MADQSLQYLQQVIHDIHALVAHEPDPEAKATISKCLQALLQLQSKKMQPAPPQYGGGAQQASQGGAEGGGGAGGIQQMLQALGGGR